MPGWLIVVLISILCVAIFVVAMSLTLMIKGRNIDSEISTNKNMQRLGIKCAVHEAREYLADGDCSDAGCSGNCAGCDVEQEQEQSK